MANIERKNYTLTVYNTLTRKNEEIEVSEEVYQTYRRTAWNIDDNMQRNPLKSTTKSAPFAQSEGKSSPKMRKTNNSTS